MPAKPSRSQASRPYWGRQWRPGASRRAPRRPAPVAEFQRGRLLKAVVELVSERDYARVTAGEVILRAGVSRKTFYDLYENRDDCVLAVLEESYAEIADVVTPAYLAHERWTEQLRAALEALVAFLECETAIGAFAVSYLVGCGPRDQQLRTAVLERLRGVLRDGRSQGKRGRELSPLTEEAVVGAVLAILHARLRARLPCSSALTNELMWTIVLPYLGPASAAGQLNRPAPTRAVLSPAPARDPLRDLDMRLTYRTGRTLEAIALEPGANNAEIAARTLLADQGQMSKLLARLARLGLIENTGPGQSRGGANAWHLTPTGSALEAAIRRKSATAGH